MTQRLTRRRLVLYVGAAVVVALGVHVAYPALAGVERSVDVLSRANGWWIAVAFGCSALSLGCYVAVFRHVVGAGDPRLGWRASYEIAMASQAASTVVTAGGAGGIALVFWALGRAGLDRAQAARRIVAFLAFHYAIYLGALIMFGVPLWLGVLPGRSPAGLTIVPAVIALAVIGLAVLAARSPARLERRLVTRSAGAGRLARGARKLLTVPPRSPPGCATRACCCGRRRAACCSSASRPPTGPRTSRSSGRASGRSGRHLPSQGSCSRSSSA